MPGLSERKTDHFPQGMNTCTCKCMQNTFENECQVHFEYEGFNSIDPYSTNCRFIKDLLERRQGLAAHPTLTSWRECVAVCLCSEVCILSSSLHSLHSLLST